MEKSNDSLLIKPDSEESNDLLLVKPDSEKFIEILEAFKRENNYPSDAQMVKALHQKYDISPRTLSSIKAGKGIKKSTLKIWTDLLGVSVDDVITHPGIEDARLHRKTLVKYIKSLDASKLIAVYQLFQPILVKDDQTDIAALDFSCSGSSHTENAMHILEHMLQGENSEMRKDLSDWIQSASEESEESLRNLQAIFCEIHNALTKRFFNEETNLNKLGEYRLLNTYLELMENPLYVGSLDSKLNDGYMEYCDNGDGSYSVSFPTLDEFLESQKFNPIHEIEVYIPKDTDSDEWESVFRDEVLDILSQELNYIVADGLIDDFASMLNEAVWAWELEELEMEPIEDYKEFYRNLFLNCCEKLKQKMAEAGDTTDLQIILENPEFTKHMFKKYNILYPF